MNLPQTKIRNDQEFYLINNFDCKIDAAKDLKRIKNENALFGRRKHFIFETKKTEIVLKYGIYEQNILAFIIPQ